ncbi:MAG: GNAT family N-acetyltransferase [Flavobacteriaceae bacterium]
MIRLEHIEITPVKIEDAWKICDFAVANEHRMKAYFPLTLAQNLTPDLSKRFTTLKAKQFETNEEYLFIVKPKESRAVIALVYIKELDWDKHHGEFAYCVDYNWEGKGITSLVVKELSKFAFTKLNLKTLEIKVHKDNIASVRVAEKCNFTWQRTLKNEYTPPGGNPMDMELYELYKV